MILTVERLKRIFFAALAPAIVPIYYVSFLYLNNVDEVVLGDLAAPLWISLLIGGLSMFVFSSLTRDLNKGAILSGIFFVAFLNFRHMEAFIQRLTYEIRYWHILPVVVVLLIGAAYIIHKHMSHETAEQVRRVMVSVFALLIGMNLVMNFSSITQVFFGHDGEKTNDIAGVEIVEGQPNTYFIILDEYSNFDMLEKYYGDDNKEFHDFLVNKGFTVSEHSQNERMNQLTTSFTTNYLNLDYVIFDSDSFNKVLQYRINPPLFQMFYQNGYEIRFHPHLQIEWNGSYGSSGSSKGATTIDGSTFRQLFFANNMFYPFTQKTDDTYDRQVWYDAYNFLLDNIAESNQSNFVYVHTIGGHEPFVFDENGDPVPSSERENLVDPQYYLGQYKYVTRQIEYAIDRILEDDPHSVIILMSDHSMRSTRDAGGKNIVLPEDKVTILNAVYFLGESITEINNQSGVNTLRLIMDRLFDTNLGVVEVPAA